MPKLEITKEALEFLKAKAREITIKLELCGG